jgi:hypothetical protein
MRQRTIAGMHGPHQVEQNTAAPGPDEAAQAGVGPNEIESPVGLRRPEVFVGRLLSGSRYLILLAIVGSVVSSGGVLVYSWFAGFAEAADDVAHLELDSAGVKKTPSR